MPAQCPFEAPRARYFAVLVSFAFARFVSEGLLMFAVLLVCPAFQWWPGFASHVMATAATAAATASFIASIVCVALQRFTILRSAACDSATDREIKTLETIAIVVVVDSNFVTVSSNLSFFFSKTHWVIMLNCPQQPSVNAGLPSKKKELAEKRLTQAIGT